MVRTSTEAGSSRRAFLRHVAMVAPVGHLRPHIPSVTTRRICTAADSQTEQDAWPQAQHDAGKSGYNPVATGPSPPPEISWRFDEPTARIHPPSVVGDTVYVGGDEGIVYAISTADGSVRWRFDTESDWGVGVPAVADSTVYVPSLDTNIYAIDATTGEERWRFEEAGSFPTNLAVTDGTVYAGFKPPDSTVRALDAATGKVRWQFESPAVVSSPTATEGLVYVGTPVTQTADETTVYALDAATGDEQWRFDKPTRETTIPVVADGTVYVSDGPGAGAGRADGIVYAVDAVTGEEQWRFDQPVPRTLVPAVADDIAYVGSPGDVESPDGTVYAFSTADGTLRWLFVQSRPLFPLFTAVSDTVYVANGTDVDALDAATGDLRWRFTESPRPDGAPVVVGETAYIVAVDGTLYAVT